MKTETLAGFKNINAFVDWKLAKLEETDKTMRSLFGLMFSEEGNTFVESTDGFRIRKVTYGESKRHIQAAAAAIAEKTADLEKGAIVGLYLDNSLEWLELFWAILMAGYRPLLVNTRIDDDTLARVFAKYCVGAVISKDKDFALRNIRPTDLTEGGEAPTPDVFADEVLLMSSNTSSHLKICAYTGEQFYYQIKDSGYILKESDSIQKHYEGELKLLTFLPFYHVFGLVAVYIWFCFFSRTLVLLKDFHPKTIVNTVRKHQVTHIFAVPLFWEKIYKTAMDTIAKRGERTLAKFQRGMKIAESLEGQPLSHKLFTSLAFREVRENIFGDSISFLINGGGYLSPEAYRFMNGIGYHLVNGYGMTEVGITSVELSEKPAEWNKASVGHPFHSLSYLVNADGELLIKGKSIAKRIYSEDGVTENEGLWFNTHDLFTEKNGKYYIDGRKDDLIVCRNGENINPNIIEPMLAGDGILNLCLFGDGDKTVLLAEVNRYVGAEKLVAVADGLNGRIAACRLESMINAVVLTDTPLLGENDFKLNRKKIKERYRHGEFAVKNPDGTDDADGACDALTARIRAIFAGAIGKTEEEISLDGHFFFDLGGTSLDYFTMVTSVQNEFEISFPASLQSSVSTVREMVAFIRNN